MNDVASLELCKELYELSGWLPDEDEQVGSYYVGGSGHYVNGTPATKSTPLQIPAYDLGYLLRKLPRCQLWKRDDGVYTAQYVVSRRGLDFQPNIKCKADTPEDAAAKLAIELFKQGILK